ncbi:MAG: hypothetical protein AAGA54_33025 [Myxococcota bacterium]
MRKTTILLSLAFAATTLTGCDDDVTKLCKKMGELVEKEKDVPKKMKEEAADIEGCKTKMEEEKKKDPEKFKKMSECIMGASDFGGVFKCAMEAEGMGDDKKEEKKE